VSNLFDDYKDSPDSMVIEAAAIPLGIAVVCLAGGVLALRRRWVARSSATAAWGSTFATVVALPRIVQRRLKKVSDD
jgi:hypothetical protein